MTTDWGTTTDGFHEWEQDYIDGDVTLSVATGKGSIVLAGDVEGAADTGLFCTTGALDTWRTGAAIYSGRFALPEWSTDTTEIFIAAYPWDREDSPFGYVGFWLDILDDTGFGEVKLMGRMAPGTEVSTSIAGIPLTAPAHDGVYLRVELGVWFDPDLAWIRVWPDDEPRPADPTLVLALDFSAFTALHLHLDPYVSWDGTDPHSYEFLFDYWRYEAIDADDVPLCPIDDFERIESPGWGTASGGGDWSDPSVTVSPALFGTGVLHVVDGYGRGDFTIPAIVTPNVGNYSGIVTLWDPSGGDERGQWLPTDFDFGEFRFAVTSQIMAPNFPDFAGVDIDTTSQGAEMTWTMYIQDYGTSNSFRVTITINKLRALHDADPTFTTRIQVQDSDSGTIVLDEDLGELAVAWEFDWSVDRSQARGTTIFTHSTFGTFEVPLENTDDPPVDGVSIEIIMDAGATNIVSDTWAPHMSHGYFAGSCEA